MRRCNIIELLCRAYTHYETYYTFDDILLYRGEDRLEAQRTLKEFDWRENELPVWIETERKWGLTKSALPGILKVKGEPDQCLT